MLARHATHIRRCPRRWQSCCTQLFVCSLLTKSHSSSCWQMKAKKRKEKKTWLTFELKWPWHGAMGLYLDRISSPLGKMVNKLICMSLTILNSIRGCKRLQYKVCYVCIHFSREDGVGPNVFAPPTNYTSQLCHCTFPIKCIFLNMCTCLLKMHNGFWQYSLWNVNERVHTVVVVRHHRDYTTKYVPACTTKTIFGSHTDVLPASDMQKRVKYLGVSIICFCILTSANENGTKQSIRCFILSALWIFDFSERLSHLHCRMGEAHHIVKCWWLQKVITYRNWQHNKMIAFCFLLHFNFFGIGIVSAENF